MNLWSEVGPLVGVVRDGLTVVLWGLTVVLWGYYSNTDLQTDGKKTDIAVEIS